MKTLTTRFLTLFGIALLAAAMVFSFVSCQPEPNSAPPSPPDIPTVLQNTTWTHSSGDKISFDKTSVTVTPSGSSSGTKFPLKDVNQTTAGSNDIIDLFFNDDITIDFIRYMNGTITMVNLGSVKKSNDWNNGDIPPVDPLKDFQWKETIDSPTLHEEHKINKGNKYINIFNYRGNGGDVIIPAEINGLPVCTIHRTDSVSITFGFKNKQITSITFPDSIERFDNNAFEGNPLVSITIGSNCKNMEIEEYPFNDPFGEEIGFWSVYKNANKAGGTYTRPNTTSKVWTRVN